jgi:hypothetical protein
VGTLHHAKRVCKQIKRNAKGGTGMSRQVKAKKIGGENI